MDFLHFADGFALDGIDVPRRMAICLCLSIISNATDIIGE